MKRIELIFLIEDDIEDQELFQEALEHVDSSVNLMTAHNGVDALDKLNSATLLPDVIILDINMPKMNGKQFLEVFQQDNHLNTVPVIIYSTSSEAKYIEELMNLGAKHFFKKPDTFDQLCKEISQIINGS